MKITEKTLEDAIRKTEEKLELLKSQLQVLKQQRMIDLKTEGSNRLRKIIKEETLRKI
jgi:hypothetical protein